MAAYKTNTHTTIYSVLCYGHQQKPFLTTAGSSNQMTTQSFNGWSSHASWNCSLWINNDEGLYRFCRSLKHNNITKWSEVSRLLTIQFGSSVTPDNVAWELADAKEMERMLQEL